MSNNQFRDCKKFRYGDVVEYVAVSPEYEYLNGSVGHVSGGVVSPVFYHNLRPRTYSYPITWIIVMGQKRDVLRGSEFCDEDRLRKVVPQR
jgi:hypothetical protein